MRDEIESDLIESAEAQEREYNLAEAAQLYEQVAKLYVEESLLEKAAQLFEKVGNLYSMARWMAETVDVYEDLINKTVNAYKEALNLFKRLGSKFEELECEALILYFRFSRLNQRTDSPIEAHKNLKNSLELIMESYELCPKDKDREILARILMNVTMISSIVISFVDDPKEIIDLYQKGMDLSFKACNAAIEVKNILYLAGSMLSGTSHLIVPHGIFDFRQDENYIKNIKKFLLIIEKTLGFIKKYNNSWALGYIYYAAGNIYFSYGFYHVEDEIEQNEYFDKSINLFEKALDHARTARIRILIIYILCFLDWYSMIFGRVQYVQKRIISDINEILELGKVYERDISPIQEFSFFLPAFYYTNMAQMSIFNSSQRKIYAKKGIEYSLKVLKCQPMLLFLWWGYQFLTFSHSQLSYLITSKDKREKHVKKMLDYVNQIKNVSDKYEGGFARATRYSCIYKAHKTLSDLSDNEEEKIEMLAIAIDASKNYLGHAIESRTGIIVGRMRLGLLYEELGMLNQNFDTLMEGRDVLLQVIKECKVRGYRSYLAATYEYIARLEDRLGNFSSSAKYYENAKDAYAETIDIIEYRLLRRRVNEKMKYAKAWNLIENAKAHHKKENHLEAKENYKSAYEILKDLPNFNYEALYYFAWSFQEEAELLSKQENHDKAIEQYEMTKNIFNDALKTMEKISTKTKNEIVVERIENLGKVAKLRIKYCSARLDVEKARILGKQGNYLEAAELFASAASLFRDVCNLFKVERERSELEAVYYLCRAWECMEFAEKYEEPDRFSEAAKLFLKASTLFSDSKLKLLASGNSTFCLALEIGCKFDEAHESEVKAQLYPKIKGMLRNAASTYEKGDFENGSNWALATSTYFDAAWHLIRADEEMNLDEKGRLLEVGSGLLKSTAELFSDAGYKEKEKEVLKRLSMVQKEEKIIFSALNSIKKPDISSSTIGIIAPVCSLETSQSPRLGEIQQITQEITEESRRVLIKRAERPIEIYECETNLNILHLSDIQEGRFGIKEDMSKVKEAYFTFLSDLKDKLEIIHRKNKIDFIVISGDLTSTASKEEFYYLTNEFLPILNEVFLEGKNPVPKNRWIIVPGNHDVEWERGSARFNNFIEFCQENGFHHYNLNDPESIYSRIVCKDKSTGNSLGIIGLNSCLNIIDENSRNAPRLSNSYFSVFSRNWDDEFRKMPKLMVCHHTLHAIKSGKFDHALNKLKDNNVLLALVGDIHKSESHADEISNIRCIPAGTITASKSERQVGIDEVSRQFNLINLNLQSGYVKWYTYQFEGTWRKIKNESFYLEHPSFSK